MGADAETKEKKRLFKEMLGLAMKYDAYAALDLRKEWESKFGPLY
jgi:hypothetical protein